MISDEKIDFMNFLTKSANKFREYEASNKVMHISSNSLYDIDPITLIKEDCHSIFNLDLPSRDLKNEKDLFIAYWEGDKFFYASSLDKLKIGLLIFSIIIMNYLDKNCIYTSVPYRYENISKEELEELFYELFKEHIGNTIKVWDEYEPWKNMITSDTPSLYYIKISNKE